MENKQQLINFLESNNIDVTEITVDSDHFPPPDSFWEENNIHRCKNLFFRDNHGKNHFLVIFDYYKKIDIKNLSKIVGRGSLSFASGWRLEKYLDLTPGFISVFGLINDTENHVKVILDEELNSDKNLSFLPNTAGKSFFSLSFRELCKFIDSCDNKMTIHKL